MRVLVTGSRDFGDRALIYAELDHVYDRWLIRSSTSERFILVEGECPYGGADLLARQWVLQRNKRGAHILLDPHPPLTSTFGARAFGIRNHEMVALGADLCLAFFQYGARNRGTFMTVGLCRDYGIPIQEYWSSRTIIDVELP